MRALSIRQPYAELILRGIKTVEYRSPSTRIIGDRFYIYASKGGGGWRNGTGQKAWSFDLSTKGDPPPWMPGATGRMYSSDLCGGPGGTGLRGTGDPWHPANEREIDEWQFQHQRKLLNTQRVEMIGVGHFISLLPF